MIKKKCYSCGEDKPLEEFKKDNRRLNGRSTICRKCHNAINRVYFKKNREIQTTRLKNWRKENREYFNKQSSEYRKTPKEKIRKLAHDQVYYAIKTGKLIKEPCKICGKEAQAHHSDYSKYLEVDWLCRTHHADWHLNNKPKNI